jgi:hypothetical protein
VLGEEGRLDLRRTNLLHELNEADGGRTAMRSQARIRRVARSTPGASACRPARRPSPYHAAELSIPHIRPRVPVDAVNQISSGSLRQAVPTERPDGGRVYGHGRRT